uniref:C2H2-type domain-containing protein n=1 Tax=Panagrolaimus sp. PS1159 TaxID=55785 RepID=A0AC35FV80_9BILA
MTIVSPQISFNYLSAVIVSLTLGALFALLVCGLICICRILHSSSPTFECENNFKMRQEGVRSCPEVYVQSFEHRRPAIIGSRKRKPIDREEIVDPLLQEEIDQDLSADFQVQNGMLVVAPPKQKPLNSLPSSSTTAAVPRRVVVVNSGDPNSFLRPRPLPGTADEVESYPCRICNRVFLTDNGLLKHAENEHPIHLRLINEDIQFITSEWKRRELHLAVKKNIGLPTLKSRKNFIIRPKSPGVYEVCNICENLIKLDTPDALNRHKQKHLTEGDTPAILHHLNCSQCSLTFMSHESYIKHIGSHRKRTFVCRYCGSRFPHFSELKRHKAEYHEYKPGYSNHNFNRVNNAPSSIRRSLNFRFPESSNVRASCDKCDLSFHKVELLIRHIITVHQSKTFNAKINVRGMPIYGIIVKDGTINYQCCNLIFEDKAGFCDHRQSEHLPAERN